jgi:molecular chaperone DnaK (HSP70)
VAQTNGNAECLANDKDFNDNVSLVVFDAWTDHLVECLEAPITAALAAAGEKTSAMKTVEIVSGGSRVLAVKKFIAKLLGLDRARTNFGLSATMNADEAVSRGVALKIKDPAQSKPTE